MIIYFKKYKKVFFTFLILTFLFYGNALRNKYALDDDYITVTNFPQQGKQYIPNHPLVSKGFKGIIGIWKSRYAHDSEGSFDYRPFTTTTFAIEYGIFGQNPFISHLVNLLLYFICVWLIFCVVLKLLNTHEYGFLISFLCSLFFLIHPIHTEVVNNLKCRDELLAFLCSLSALWFSLDAYEKPNFKNILLIIMFLIIGLFSKRTAILFLAIIPMSIFFFRKVNAKHISFISILLVLAASLIPLVKNNIVSEKVVRHFYHFENPLYTDNVPFLQKIIIGFKTFGFYIKFLLFPYPFRSYYGANTFDLSADLNLYFFIAIGFLAICAFYIYKFKSKLLLFAALLFCGCIIPFVNVGSPAPGVLAERFAYFSSFGFCLILAIIIVPYIKNFNFKSVAQFLSKPLVYLLPLMIICMAYTWNRNSNWHDKITLFEHDAPYLQNSSKANSLLGNEYFEMLSSPQKKYPVQTIVKKGIEHYQLAIANDSSIFTAYNNAGVLCFSYLNDLANAKRFFSMAIQHKEQYNQAMENLGNTYKALQNYDSAIICYKKVISYNYKQYNSSLGIVNCLIAQKKYEKAISISNLFLDIYPNDYSFLIAKANCFVFLDRKKEALLVFELAYQIQPANELKNYMSSLIK